MITLISTIAALIFGFCIGRYFFWTKAGAGIVSQIKVDPKRVIDARHFKGDIHKMMAMQLLKNGSVEVQTKDIKETVRKVAAIAKLKGSDLTTEGGRGNAYLIKRKQSDEQK